MGVKIQGIQACADWFFVEPGLGEGGKPQLSRLAAWGTVVGERGQEAIVGLVAVKAVAAEEFKPRVPRLVPVPALDGYYKHLADLTPQETEALKRK